MKKIILFFAMLFFSTAATQVAAQQRVQATPHPIKYTQPNGVEIEYRLRGDANLKYTTTLDGYLIKRKDNGYFYYLTYNESKERYVTRCKVKAKTKKIPKFAIKSNAHYISTIKNKSAKKPM